MDIVNRAAGVRLESRNYPLGRTPTGRKSITVRTPRYAFKFLVDARTDADIQLFSNTLFDLAVSRTDVSDNAGFESILAEARILTARIEAEQKRGHEERLRQWQADTDRRAAERLKRIAEEQPCDVMYFGCHKGRKVDDLPISYVRWCLETIQQDDDPRWVAIKTLMQARLPPPAPPHVKEEIDREFLRMLEEMDAPSTPTQVPYMRLVS